MSTAELEKRQAKLKKFGSLKTLGDKVANRTKKAEAQPEKLVDVYLRLPLDEITSKAQVRKKFIGIKELAESIAEGGLEQPIHVLPKNKDGMYVIAKGERRYRACKLLKMDEIPAIVQEQYKTTSERILSQLVENIQRDDLEPYETAEAFVELKKEGVTNKKIAKRMGVSETFVSRHMTFYKASSYIVDLSKNGLVRDIDTLTFIRKLDEIAPERAKLLIEKAEDVGEISRTEAKTVYNMVKEELNKKATDAESEPDLPFDSNETDYEKVGEVSVGQVSDKKTSRNDDNSGTALIDEEIQVADSRHEKSSRPAAQIKTSAESSSSECIPGSGVITNINAVINRKKKSGVLLLGLSEKSSEHVWVQLKGSNMPERVKVNQISIVSVSRAGAVE